ncbi:bifunctional 5,10-methylenetetrahydrofolate dehydrogenase/5,10-methenyltetrahydrofolate cyclohydrolase [Spiroplasma turonicum]|uniref:Bifunctional protein FolD n=1 Tax=Spiroplasma turonicum TaxID=216946 RepID=A0A0K1P7F2_9MOLU|nr:bifunctional 5,10-methylenetetrahydrofolate dehydrogenase/5,10-methenyltetrahydrofolate cyclohydrolase [Spiroplasma turonicum]AKU80218.1 methylenetetrahydrofolate dehydrogenase/methylenetetrahydrofolate cyclohydrolase [Spiroplasma turonicum]ALX71218.1 methylenetetrahydrofolate dehydrogenase/methylenetetrahydrofolate cyclohydrolase [Spiroplasma turonicum]
MSAKIISGKILSQKLNSNLKNSIAQIQDFRPPKLTIIQVGDNSASNKYIKNKLASCKKVGIETDLLRFDENITESQLEKELIKLNNDNLVDGILVQLPLPKHINEKIIKNLISVNKDADGFNPQTLGNVLLDDTDIYPATPLGIIKLLESENINLLGANVTIIGRSNIVGKPLATILINKSATVTICNTKTKNLAKVCRQADILISAAGTAKLVTKKFVNKNMTVIDVGANFVNGIYCGDVDFEKVSKIVKYITPVPGGVGPMTISCLLENVYKLYIKHSYNK